MAILVGADPTMFSMLSACTLLLGCMKVVGGVFASNAILERGKEVPMWRVVFLVVLAGLIDTLHALSGNMLIGGQMPSAEHLRKFGLA